MNFKKYHVSRNLFDKDSGNILSANIGTGGVITYASSTRVVYLPVTPNTTYTVSKILSARFTVAFTDEIPDINVQTTGITSGNTQTKITATSGANSSYMAIYCYHSSYDTVSFQDILDSIMVNTGNEALPYEPYSSEVWHDIPHYIHNTSTDTLTTLPAVLYPNAVTATVGLKGQAVQSSVPSPTSPVMPQGTGERTGNLWDEDYTGINTNAIYRPLFVGDGVFTLSTNFKPNQGLTDIFLLSGNVSSGISSSTNGAYEGKNITAQSVNGYITIAYRANARPNSGSLPYCKTMLNTGSTPLPYEIFGYKIPISSASTTTPVYLGEVQTTREIGKIVLDGTIPLSTRSGEPTGIYYKLCADLGITPVAYEVVCSHFSKSNTNRVVDMADNTILLSASTLYIRYTATNDINTWLASNPVIIWYVLANEETGIVNEPIRKIGDYADEVSGITIPTIAGANSFDVLTTLKPSEVTVNYKGWHPVQSVHERDNGAWT